MQLKKRNIIRRLRNFLRLWILKKLTVHIKVDVTFVAIRI